MTVPATIEAQLARRSVASLTEPGPSDEQLALILRAAVTVPDHGNLRPWRFVVVRGEAREAFGDALADAAAEALGDAADRPDKIRGKAFVAPALIVLIASPKPSPKVPASEQRASAACTGYAIALAADALGLGAVWKTAPFLEGTRLTALLDLQPGEEVLGWVNLGHRLRDAQTGLPRPEVAAVAAELGLDGTLQPLPTA